MSDQRDVPEDFAAEGPADLPADLPANLAADVQEYANTENLEDDAAVRQLLRDGIDQWRIERAIDRLDAGDISFDRAVEIADMTPWEFADRLEDRGIQWVDSDHLSHDLGKL